MQLDNEQQRKLLMDIIEATNVPGNALDVVFQLKQSILKAPLEGIIKAPIIDDTLKKAEK